MTFPAPDPNVQLARILGGVADVKQDVEDLRKDVGQVRQEWQHYSGKIDQIHAAVYGNGGPGLRERVAVIEAVRKPEADLVQSQINASSDMADVQLKEVKSGSIDWKWLALVLVNLVIVVLVARMTT
jgi:hypothetical protein